MGKPTSEICLLSSKEPHYAGEVDLSAKDLSRTPYCPIALKMCKGIIINFDRYFLYNIFYG